eukprot:TRINITY_DN10633_c0_g2_i1.p1 TRINITY_DN10633_c0_g2~~TRINITY_DN10633_c0_g2_i1.p1  ORF type:complete len:376 (-),score=56.54 TRINITY_DN10633_c0_g2_i1:243-1370(-)
MQNGFVPMSVRRKRNAEGEGWGGGGEYNLARKKARQSGSFSAVGGGFLDTSTGSNSDLNTSGIQILDGTTYSTPSKFSNRSSQLNSSYSSYSPSIFNSPSHFSGVSATPRQRRVFKTKDCAECLICSDDVFEVKHPHFSTQNPSPPKNDYGKKGPFDFCKLCRSRHVRENDSSRLNIVLSSSTLHNVWRSQYYTPDQHIDFDTIIGGRIHDIHASFLYQYSHLPNPMDILLVCGNNNIPTQDTEKEIITQFKSLINTIRAHSIDNNHRIPNRIVLCTILYAPKFSDNSLPRNRNMTDKIRKVNAWIHNFNDESTGLHMKIHLNGVEGDPDTQFLKHKYDDWNEPEVHRKLHLSSHVKDKIAGEIIQLFRDIKAND